MLRLRVAILILSVVFAHAHAAFADRPVQIVLGGDVMAPIRLKRVALEIGLENEFYFGSLFRSLKPIVSKADLAFANLETPIAKSQPVKPVPFVFNAPQELLSGLKWAGFDVLSIANNHSLDQKIGGVSETLAAVQAEGLTSVGAGRDREEALSGTVQEVRGVKIGFLAFTAFINGGSRSAFASQTPYINLTERHKDLLSAVDKMKTKADVILVSLHWGNEYESRPQKWQSDLADVLHARGVDVIIGHHPHVLQPARWFVDRNGRKKLTLYSMGNLISNQSSAYTHGRSPSSEGNTRDSLLIQLQLTKNGVENFSFYPLWIDNWSGPEEGISTVVIAQEIERLQAEINNLRPSPKRSFLISRQQMLKDRSQIIFRSLFPNAIAPSPHTRLTKN